VHSLLTEASWKEADLCDLIQDQLLQGAVHETRITAWGPAISLEAQMALHLALVLHELGTNAHKFGALSAPSGWVTIGWTVEGELLRLRWEERGGPVVTSQIRPGFGTTLIEQSIKSQGGSARMSVGTDGVLWEIRLRLPGPTASNGSTSHRPRMIDSTSAPQRLHAAARARGRLSGKRFLVVEDDFLSPAI
jgi:two-component sensor histidine kinase